MRPLYLNTPGPSNELDTTDTSTVFQEVQSLPVILYYTIILKSINNYTHLTVITGTNIFCNLFCGVVK